MSNNTIKLLTLLNENLLEIGDLKNIESYSISKDTKLKYHFISEDEDRVDVNFTLLTPLEVSRIDIPSIINIGKIDYYFNLGYSIKGISSQAKKSNISELLKIIKTILKIVEDFKKTYSNSAILIFEENKDETLGITKGQKSPLYQSVVNQNLPTNHTSKNVIYNGVEGLIITPK
jgi:hypothetical protein